MISGKDLKLGFIGFGELASGIARELKKEGLRTIWAYDKVLSARSDLEKAMREKAEEEGVGLVESPEKLVSQVQVFLSAVIPSEALRVAQVFAPLLKIDQIYADLNSCSPQLKVAAGKEMVRSGASYVDVGVVGGVAIQGHRIPCLACGDAAEKLKSILTPFGMNIRVIDGPVGTAARMKMLRSVVLKGIEALLLEMLTAAKEYGLEEEMMDSVAKTFDQGKFKDYSNMLMTTHTMHAGRRLAEMEMVVETVKESGIKPFLSEGIVNFFDHSVGLELDKHFKGNVPEDYREVTSAIRKLSHRL